MAEAPNYMSVIKERISLQILEILKDKENIWIPIFNHLVKVDKFLDKYKLLKLRPKEMENLNYSVSIKEIEYF